ncbi:MAG: DUF480 domain-containing protein [Pirellulaceae bacterium]|nr:DUF480 domain-containing protein [Pirellulaceae bacterium]
MPTATVETLPQWKPIPARQRRLLGVMMEKAKTTPDAYPLSLAGLVTGANQKSNRYPLMNLTPEQVEDELTVLRRLGAAAEIQGSGRVPKYRHYGHTWLGVKGAEAAVMIELLLRGHQTAGDLRGRASRFEPIADLPALQTILSSLMERKLVIALTPPGRGQLFTHSLYMPEELEALRGKITLPADEEDEQSGAAGSKTPRVSLAAELSAARDEIVELKAEIARLQAKLEHLDG